MLDLGPATDTLSALVRGVRDDQLTDPTPCADTDVAALLDHIDGFAQAFTAAARKVTLPGAQAPSADGSRLAADWRTRIPALLATLAAAWRAEQAWTGMTGAGGVEVPGEAAGLFALDEIVVHGWDLAVATRQPYDVDTALLEANLGLVRGVAAENPAGQPGLFGPAVPVADDAPPLDRLLGLTGRAPAWRPGAWKAPSD